MSELHFKVRYAKDTSLIMSVSDFKKLFLFGLNIQRYGQPMPDEVYEQMLRTAQEKMEEFLQVKLVQQLYTEDKAFWNTDWQNWGYIPTQFPVKCPIDLSGYFGAIKQTTYPKEWLSAKSTSDGQYLLREVTIVPNVASAYSQNIVFQGVLPNINYYGNRQIPNYWRLTYVTGFDRNKIPQSIVTAIGKLAALDILAIASDALLPYPGVGSTSISLDGLSQSISSFASGTNGIFGARVKQYGDDLYGKTGRDGELKRLYDTYGAIIWGCA
jgi:hypothetical protein